MRHTSSIPLDTRGNMPPGAIFWTGEVQAIAVGATSSAATEITIEGRWFYVYATCECHLLFGNAGIHTAHATQDNRCFPVPNSGPLLGPIYVPDSFDVNKDGTGKLYVRVIRASADGYLYLIAGAETNNSLQRGATSTSSSTTTTSTTTTSSTTTSSTTTT